MMRCRMVFRKITSPIDNAFFPVDYKLALPYVVMDPVETHIDGSGALLFDTVIGVTSYCAVAGLDWRCRFWMPKFFEPSALGGQASLPSWKNDASSDSDALESPSFNIWQNNSMARSEMSDLDQLEEVVWTDQRVDHSSNGDQQHGVVL